MLSLVIPAYNEEQRIEGTIKSYYDWFSRKPGKGYEIIVVCDGTDKTAQIVKKLASKNRKLRLLSFEAKLGKGGAILRGFEAAKGDVIGFIDADEAVSPRDFQGMIEKLGEADCVIASRRSKGARILSKQPLQRRLCSRLFNIALRILFGLGVSDTQCGAKVMNRRAYDAIKGKMRSTGFEFDAELIWRIKGAGFRILESPITWRHTKYSKFSLKRGPSMCMSLLRLRVFG